MKNATLLQGACAALMLAWISGCATSQSTDPTLNHIILVGHGVPARDYPKDRLREFFRSHSDDHTHESGADHSHAISDHERLEQEIRNWPRTPENDPYKVGVEEMADRLRSVSQHKVVVAFNEFCAPTLEQAIDRAVEEGATRIVVITTMMTPGGGHSEVDIPTRIVAARKNHPDIEIVYAWPFDVDLLATAFAAQVAQFEG